MKLDAKQLLELNKVAIFAALEAAKIISGYSGREYITQIKSAFGTPAAQVVTEVDRLCQEKIISILTPTIDKFNLGLLAEESEDDESRLVRDYFWCIDPMDGTLSFVENRKGYSVSIALVSKEGIPQTAVVVNPLDNNMYHSTIGKGFFINGKEIRLDDFNRSQEVFTLVIDRGFLNHPYYEKTLNYFHLNILDWGFKELNIIDTGGAVMNALWVLENAPGCYFKFPKKEAGGGSFWDFASTISFYSEIGSIAVDFNNNPILLNSPESVFLNKNGVIFCTDERIKNAVLHLYHVLKIG
jgi:fructose-1,6-bisphosphatase/inositol monophosphatase family enzyme